MSYGGRGERAGKEVLVVQSGVGVLTSEELGCLTLMRIECDINNDLF